MRVELEFGLKFIIDPAQPIAPQEIRSLDQAYALFRGMQLNGTASDDDRSAIGKNIRLLRAAAATQAIKRNGGDLVLAAEELGVSRRALFRWLQEDRPTMPPGADLEPLTLQSVRPSRAKGQCQECGSPTERTTRQRCRSCAAKHRVARDGIFGVKLRQSST